MITLVLRRGLPALALAAMPLLPASTPAAADTPPDWQILFTAPTSARSAEREVGAAARRAGEPLAQAIDRIPVAAEHREGYKRDLYKHWNKGLNSTDGCNTRKEVILSEALSAPQVAAGCKLTGGSWRSAYDGLTVTDASRLDADHFVPLAEVYDSEQTPWSAARREAYANDQDSPDTLIAVSAASNRSKSDKDPAQWLPPDATYHCTYAASWVGTKLRWDLAADTAERQALLDLAGDCPATTVTYQPAP